MRKYQLLLLTTCLFVAVSASTASADEWHRNRDIHRFHEHDYNRWRTGNWHHGSHEGRKGWWWVAGGSWYYYQTPVYPYPDPYTPSTIIVEQPQQIVVGQPPSYVYYCANPAGYYPYITQCYTAWQRVAQAEVMTQPAPQIVQQAPVIQPAPIVQQPQLQPGQMPGFISQQSQQQAYQQQAYQQQAAATTPREVDALQLESYSAEFENISLKDKRAKTKLKNLAERVDVFRDTLYERSYNAMDLLKQSDELKDRIENKKAKLASNKK